MARSNPARYHRPVSRNLKPLGFVLSYLRPYRMRVIWALVSLIVAAGTVLAIGQGLRYLIDIGFDDADPALLDRSVLILFGVALLLALATFGRFYNVSWLGERVVADIRRDLYAHVLTLEPGFFELTRTAEIQSRLTTDMETLQTVVGSTISVALRNGLLLIGGLVLLVLASAKLTGLILVVVPLVVAPIIIIGRKVRALSRLSQDRIASLGVQIDETLHAVRTVQAFGQEDSETKRFGDAVHLTFETARARITARAILTAIVIMLVFGAISVLLWIGGHDVLAGRISEGDLSGFIFYAAVTAAAVGALSEVATDLQRAAGAAERLSELMATRPTIQAPSQPQTLAQPVRGAVRFADVDFFYPARPAQAALRHLDLSIQPGETVAVVGPSGAGKTTLFQLILRFYDPQSGSVRFDGQDLRQLDPRELRRHIAVVPQEPVIFAASAAANIRYGRPDASEADIIRAAEAAHAMEFIRQLPDGLNSELGERGVRLSGGQRQRIAIARAILRDPALLLLDEATSSLDAESERLVQAALATLMRGRTTLVIAHRLATVVKADRIIVMDRGGIIETGTHGELVARGGLYAHLAALQFGLVDGKATLGPDDREPDDRERDDGAPDNAVSRDIIR